MKLLFPNGEHEPIELKDGDTFVGSASDCQVMLAAPGIGARHCVLRTRGEQTSVRPLDAQAPTVLNGKQISVETPLKPGDLVLFAKVGCRVVSVEKTPPLPKRPLPAAGDDDGRTRVRMALPKFMIRGVSGPTFGKTYAVVGSMTNWMASNSVCVGSHLSNSDFLSQTLTASTTTFLSLNSFATSLVWGSDFWQGPHQVAQKSSTTTLPL